VTKIVFFVRISGFAADRQTESDAGSEKKRFGDKKMNDKKWTTGASVVRERNRVSLFIFLSFHFFVIFLLLVPPDQERLQIGNSACF
jgi:hypothetical protein